MFNVNSDSNPLVKRTVKHLAWSSGRESVAGIVTR